jgi:hypothetical protein
MDQAFGCGRPHPFGARQRGRSSGVPAPTRGRAHAQQPPPRSRDACRHARAARPRSPVYSGRWPLQPGFASCSRTFSAKPCARAQQYAGDGGRVASAAGAVSAASLGTALARGGTTIAASGWRSAAAADTQTLPARWSSWTPVAAEILLACVCVCRQEASTPSMPHTVPSRFKHTDFCKQATTCIMAPLTCAGVTRAPRSQGADMTRAPNPPFFEAARPSQATAAKS